MISAAKLSKRLKKIDKLLSILSNVRGLDEEELKVLSGHLGYDLPQKVDNLEIGLEKRKEYAKLKIELLTLSCQLENVRAYEERSSAEMPLENKELQNKQGQLIDDIIPMIQRRIQEVELRIQRLLN